MRLRSVLALYLVGLGIGASMARAQTPGMFTATGNMTAFRYRHSATLLEDGRVGLAENKPKQTREQPLPPDFPYGQFREEKTDQPNPPVLVFPRELRAWNATPRADERVSREFSCGYLMIS